MMTVVALAALSLLRLVHECGHYVVARWCRIRIKRIVLGFGPVLFERTWQKTGTTFQLALIPFGGSVKISGLNIAEAIDPADEHAFSNRPAWQRFVTILAGPAANYLSAVVFAMLLYTCHGTDVPHWYGVGEVMAGYDAHDKLEPGDRILEVDHVPLFIDHGPSLFERVNAAKGAAITLTIERNGLPREVSVTPRLDQHDYNHPVWRIGVRPEPQFLSVSFGIFDAAGRAIAYPIDQTKAIGAGLYLILAGSEQADPGGPRRMIEEFHRTFSLGLAQGIKLLMVLSVYLGLFSLFPVSLPLSDGNHFVLLGYEVVTRRRATPKVEAMVHRAGVVLLGVLMLLVRLHNFHAF